MMILAILVSLAVAVGCGFGLGSAPFVKENLHWNLWVVIPISGLVIGAGVGVIQFGVLRGMGQPVRIAAALLLALGCAVGYATTELGIYTSTEIELVGVEGVPDGMYPLSQLMTFEQYVEASLSASSYEVGHSGGSLDYGSTGTTITWAVDLLGAFLGGLVGLLGLANHFPYCERCGVYKRGNHKLTLALGSDDAVEVLDGLHTRVGEGDYAGVVSFLHDSGALEQKNDEQQAFRIEAVERVCPNCKGATLMGIVHRKDGREWNEVGELAFRLDSGLGDGMRLG